MKNNPIIYLWLKMWRYSEGNRKFVVIYSLMFFVANCVDLTQPLIVWFLLQEIQKYGVTNENIFYLYSLLSLFIVRGVAFWAFHGPARLIENTNAFLARAKYKTYLAEGVSRMPLEWHNNHHSGDTADKIEKGTRGLFDFSSQTFRIITVIVHLSGSFTVLLMFNQTAAAIVLASIVFAIWMIIKFDKKLVLQYRALNRFSNAISEKIVDMIINITTVVILRIEKQLTKSIALKIMEPLGLFKKNNRLNETKWFLISLSTKIMLFLVLGYFLYSKCPMDPKLIPALVATFVALYQYSDTVAEVFYGFAGMYGEILQARAAVANAEELASEFKNTDYKCTNSHVLWRELKVEALNFSYHTEEGSDLHLDDVSFSIKRGEKIAVIGATGSGKSTLLKIIRELYRTPACKVYIDGKILPGGFARINSQISLIPQEPEIFTTTIGENILVSGELDQKIIEKYSDMACLSDVIKKLPKQFDSRINEKGVNLSGGEKQRLALARGLLASENKSIVLLDEPTSSIDVSTELNIYENIFAAFPEKTIISSVHRLHLLPLFDRIYFFNEGKVITSGTFDELLTSSKEFQEIWSKYQCMVQDLRDRV